MRAFVLAGGKGSRLRPFTFSIPKPLVPIGEMPILEILVRQLAGAGFDRLTISVGHLAPLIQAFCGDGSAWGLSIDYVDEPTPLGTAGCLGQLTDLEDEAILVVNGDTLTDMDFAAAMRRHRLDSGITVCANTRSVDIEFGVLETDADGRLTSYVEKPSLSYRVSMGVNIVSRWVIEERVEVGKRLDMPDLIRALIASGTPVQVLDEAAYWLDLGRMDDLERGERIFAENRSRFLPEG